MQRQALPYYYQFRYFPEENKDQEDKIDSLWERRLHLLKLYTHKICTTLACPPAWSRPHIWHIAQFEARELHTDGAHPPPDLLRASARTPAACIPHQRCQFANSCSEFSLSNARFLELDLTSSALRF